MKKGIVTPAVKAVVWLSMFMVATAAYPAETPDLEKILADIDRLSNFDDTDFSAVYTIVAEKPGQDRSVTQARLFRRDRRDQFVLLILQPAVNRGQGYLQVDENVWFYDPDSRRFERTTLRDTVQDSNAQNRDFSQNSLSKDYRVASWQAERLGNFDVWRLDLEARHRDVSYEKMKIWVRQDQNIVLKQEDYSVNDRLMRTTVYPRYISVGNRLIPSQILIVDELAEGERTQVTVSEASVQTIPDNVFTRSYLERVAR